MQCSLGRILDVENHFKNLGGRWDEALKTRSDGGFL